MFEFHHSNRFKKDVKTCQKRGYDTEKLKELLIMLAEGVELPPKYKNHTLQGEWEGCFDAHIAPDWILIYEYSGDVIRLLRTGTHSDLF